jgi:hypothetical protein
MKKIVEIPIGRIGALIHQVSKILVFNRSSWWSKIRDQRVENQIIWSLQTQTSVYKLTSAGRATGCATGVETQAWTQSLTVSKLLALPLHPEKINGRHNPVLPS